RAAEPAVGAAELGLVLPAVGPGAPHHPAAVAGVRRRLSPPARRRPPPRSVGTAGAGGIDPCLRVRVSSAASPAGGRASWRPSPRGTSPWPPRPTRRGR